MSTFAEKYWPDIDSRATASQVSRYGVVAAVISAVITTAVVLLTLIMPSLKYDPWSLVDAALFAIIAWRIYRFSLPWAIFGLLLFVVEKIGGVISGTHGTNPASWIIALLLTACYVNSIRALLYLRKHKEIVTEVPPTPRIEVHEAVTIEVPEDGAPRIA